MTTATSLVEAPSIVPEEDPTKFEFDAAFQGKIAALTLRDTVFAQRTDGLIRPEYFQNDVDAVLVSMALDFYSKYKATPDISSLGVLLKSAIAAKTIRTEMVPDVKTRLKEMLRAHLGDRDFVIEKVADFAKERAMENALLQSAGALGKRDFAKIEKLMKTAMMVGANEDASEYDYFAEIANRTEYRKAMIAGTIKPDGITTGLEDLDKLLYHRGWVERSCPPSWAELKFGKSMALGHFGKAASMAGHSVLICSCEVSARIYADRLDANFSDIAMQFLKDKPIEIQNKVEAAAAKAGPLKIHDFASGTLKPSMLRRLLERYRTRGVLFDLIIVDYADIMAPEHYTGETREDSRMIWIDCRAIAYEQNAAFLTATQTNREGAKKATAGATDVAEDYNKIRTADLVLSGNATEAEMAANEARLHCAASRNQGEFTLRIQQDRAKMKFLKKILGKA